MERVIDLSEEPARLSVRNSLLIVARGEEPEVSVPLSEVAALCLSHPQVTLTQPVLARLAEAGAIVITCDSRRLPVGMLLPLVGHFSQAERFAAQAAAPLPTRKRLWQAIVRAKIRAQAQALQDLRHTDGGLLELVARVRSGDSTNVEAEASRRYWPVLFRDPEFRRGRFEPGRNALLNYG